MSYNIKQLIGQPVPFNGQFVFLDIETANSKGDIISIGAIVTINGVIKSTIYELVKPIGKLNKKLTDKHKITYDMVKDVPNFKEVWESKFQFVNENLIFVMHNAKSADLHFLGTDFDYYHINVPPIYFYDTCSLAKNLMRVKASRENLCNIFGIQSAESHNALSDACDCLNIFCILNSEYNVISTIKPQFYDFSTVKRKSSSDNDKFGRKRRLTTAEIAAIKVNEEPDLDFKGKVFVVTGDFERFNETCNVEEEIIKRGGIKNKKTNLTSEVDLFICGDKNFGPKKKQTAKDLHIKMVDEKTFYKMLENNDSIEVQNEKIEAVKTLHNTFEKIIEDKIATPSEINKIQDWLDEYSHLFCDEDPTRLIIPIQHFIEDGVFSANEVLLTKKIIEKYLACSK